MNTLGIIATVVYLAAIVGYAGCLVRPGSGWRRSARFALTGGLAFHAAYQLVLWRRLGYLSMGDIMEVKRLTALTMVAVYLLATRKREIPLIGGLCALVAAAVLMISLQAGDPAQEAGLLPALQSPWRVIHVSVFVVAYAAYALAYLLVLMEMARQPTRERLVGIGLMAFSAGALVALAVWSGVLVGQSGTARRLGMILGFLLTTVAVVAAGLWLGRRRSPGTDDDSEERLIEFLHRLAFPFLTLGILTGSLWAKAAWERYWFWDTKEVFSLVTWLIYVIHLHLPLLGRRGGIAPAEIDRYKRWVSVAGFWALIITWLGVAYLPMLADRLHSY